MQIFEYPYVIITILVFCFLIMGLAGLYFSIKCVKTANETEDIGFAGIGRLKNNFEKLMNARKKRCVIYICISLENMKRIHSETKAMHILSEIRTALLKHFSDSCEGDINHYSDYDFVVLNECTSADAKMLIEASYETLDKIIHDNEAVNSVKVNFGFFCTNSTEVSFDESLKRAKKAYAMAVQKNSLFSEWDSANGKEFEQKIKIENTIKSEIDNNRFFLEYQPVIDAKTEKPTGAEVLARLNSSEDGILSPQAFLSAVNNVGLNEKFDYYIFEKNCKWISNDKKKREKYVYAINFSRATLCDELFAERIIEIIERYGVKYSSLAIEILEDKDLSPEEKTSLRKNASLLKEKGVIILIDDFGSGYTSFTDLSAFDVNIVKIDKEITQNAVTETGFVILSNIIRTARELGYKTLCEGVENEEQKKAVTKAGCDFLQGFYFYRPMPVSKLEEILGL